MTARRHFALFFHLLVCFLCRSATSTPKFLESQICSCAHQSSLFLIGENAVMMKSLPLLMCQNGSQC